MMHVPSLRPYFHITLFHNMYIYICIICLKPGDMYCHESQCGTAPSAMVGGHKTHRNDVHQRAPKKSLRINPRHEIAAKRNPVLESLQARKIHEVPPISRTVSLGNVFKIIIIIKTKTNLLAFFSFFQGGVPSKSDDFSLNPGTHWNNQTFLLPE